MLGAIPDTHSSHRPQLPYAYPVLSFLPEALPVSTSVRDVQIAKSILSLLSLIGTIVHMVQALYHMVLALIRPLRNIDGQLSG